MGISLVHSRRLAALALLIVTACAPAGPARAPDADGARQSGAADSARQAAAPKSLTIAMGRDPEGFGPHHSIDANITPLYVASLTRYKIWDGTAEPWLAAEAPSVARGTWKLLPDGRMETTWRLRRDVKWHDRTPFTTGDLLFGWEVVRDRRFAGLGSAVTEMMESVSAPDDYTLVVTWNQIYVYANMLNRNQMVSLPRHLLEADYRRDPPAMATHPYFTTEFVGQGPYQVAAFEPGQGVRFEAFPDYFLGRPKIDTIHYRFLGDQNTALAQIMANEVDVTIRSTIGIPASMTAKERWEAAGHGNVYHTPMGWTWVNLSVLNPWFEDVRVRRGMLHAIDRHEIVNSVFYGLTVPPDTLIRPSHPLFPEVDRAVVKHPYDPNRARQLLTDAGWRPGGDGVLVNGRGERLSIEAQAVAGDREREAVQEIVLNYWRAVGMESRVNNLPRRVLFDNDHRGRWYGARWGDGSLEPTDRLNTDWHSRYTPTETNNWQGDNLARWAGGDSLLDLWGAELDLAKRNQLAIQVALKWAEDLPHLPLYFDVEITTIRRGITGAAPRQGSGGLNGMTWNAHEWDRV
jgi:peptide/nickel transport system substrate-binding protein